MNKVHYGKITMAGALTFCGKQGAHKANSKAAFNCAPAKMFAYLLAVEPENCCEHCAIEVKRSFPNSVKNAAANPQGFYEKNFGDC